MSSVHGLGDPAVPIVCRWRPGTLAHDTSPTYLPLPTLLLYATLLYKAWYALSSGATSRGVFGGAPGFVVPIRKCPLDHFLEPVSLHPVVAYPRCPVAACPPPRRPRPPTRVPIPAPTPEPNPGPNPNQGNTIREFSFLENPRAAALKASTASTTLVAGAGAAAELKRLVASYAETKVRPHRDTAPAT